MTTQTSKFFYTIEEFMNLPKSDQRQELVEGELFDMPPTGDEHGRVSDILYRRLGNYVEDNYLGRVWFTTGFVIDPTTPKPTVRAPDVAFIKTARVPASGPGAVPVPPDLAVEVISPSDEAGDIKKKLEQYQKAAVPLIWLIYPAKQQVQVYRIANTQTFETLGINNELDGETIVPGFKIAINKLFS